MTSPIQDFIAMTLRSGPARAAVLLTALLTTACERDAAPPAPPVPAASALSAHSGEFRRELVRVTEGVYVAVGYAHANSILIEGSDGVIVVDALGSQEAAEAVLAAFRQVTDKPIRALVYTHSHPDHIGGSAVFAPPGSGIPVYAQREVADNYSRLVSEMEPILSRRAQRMYGTPLPPAERVNIGIGLELDMGPDHHFALAAPTHDFDQELSLDIAGVQLQLVHAPGETDDQIFVWLPRQRVLMPGDNLYRAFPNLYTVRGTTYRDPRAWAASLDRMRALKPAFLVPSHTRPVSGEAQVELLLTDYGDAIRYVYQQTIRLINQGYAPDEVAHRLQLPAHLSASPWLTEFYGKASWSAKSIFAGQLGWFDGNPTHLQPLEPGDEAGRMVALAGGEAALNQQIERAAGAGEQQWVLQLTDYALRVNRDNAVARKARIAALARRAEAEVNANARNYYLTSLRELRDGLVLPRRLSEPRPESAVAIPLSAVFDGLAVNLDAAAAAEVRRSVGFEFTDTGELWTVTVRRGVTEIHRGLSADAEIHARVSAQAFKELLAGLRNPMVSIGRDFEFVKGGRIAFVQFMRLFMPADFEDGGR